MTLPFAKRSFPGKYDQALVGPLFHPWAERFHHVRSKIVSRTIRFDDGSVFARLNAMARSTDDTGLAFELKTNVVTARS